MADKKRRSFDDLFMNNKFVLAVSIILAVFLWATVSMSVGPEETRVIENVRVNLSETESNGYSAFGVTDMFVDVTVKGKKYLVSSGALSENDIVVTASSNFIDSAGIHKLKLSAKMSKNSDIKITALSQTSIEVFYDVAKTATFPVEPSLKPETKVVPDGYIYEDPILALSTVTVSGPASEINNIEKFKAVAKIEEPLTSTQELPVKLTPVLTNGKKAEYINFETEIEDVEVTVPVSMVKEIPVSVRYFNLPSYYENNMPEVNFYPKKIKVAAAESVLENMDSIVIGTVDFSQVINRNNKFHFSLDNIEEVRVIDDTRSVDVYINCYPMNTKKISISSDNITLLNVPDGAECKIIDSSINNITVVGPSNSLNKISAENVLAKIDLDSAKPGTDNYKAVIYIKGNNKCWVYGEYSVRVRISD